MNHLIYQVATTENQGCLFGGNVGLNLFNDISAKISGYDIVLEFDMTGVVLLDACCARESFACIAKLRFGILNVIFSNIENLDVLDNLIYAFKAKKIPLFVKDSDALVLYADLLNGAKEILTYAYANSNITTSDVMRVFGLSAPNASAKLRKLYMAGLLHKVGRGAATGGIEYVYSPFVIVASFSHLNRL